MATTRGRWEVKVGDEVWTISAGRGWELGTVEKIGSKLVHVRENQWRSTAYYLEDGQRRDGYSGSFRTKDHHAEMVRRTKITTSLREAYGIEISLHRKSDWSVDALELLLNTAREANEKYPSEEKD